MRIGWASLGDLLPDPVTGRLLTQQERHRMMVDGAVAAEEAGFWCAAVGEHHFCDYIISSPPVVLAAMAERTQTIRLGTAVALGANNDPIRLAEDYATLDLLSGGRVELVLGRGNLYEHTFVAFGQDPTASRAIYEERVALTVEALRREQLDWRGTTRPPFSGFTTQPRPLQAELPVWVGAGTSVDSAEFAARLGLPLMLPGVFGPPRIFVPIVEHYRARFAELGHPAERCQVGTIAHTTVAATSQAARETMAARMAVYLGWVKELVSISTPHLAGMFPPFDFDLLVERGPTVSGSPEQVIDKMSLWRDTLDLDVYLLMCDMGGMPPEELQAMLELAGQAVLPAFA
jgi:alkanesulfonate monooxygenase SsuD/methylene tetrahydromethanopterin reductase-like flavin-dependent oxidoreductase (luciferase family)